MARLLFPDEASRLLYTTGAGNVLIGASGPLAVFSDPAGQIAADLQNPDGTPIANGQVTVGANSLLPDFLGPPDGAETLYVRPFGGALQPIYASSQVRLDVVEDRVAGTARLADANTWVGDQKFTGGFSVARLASTGPLDQTRGRLADAVGSEIALATESGLSSDVNRTGLRRILRRIAAGAGPATMAVALERVTDVTVQSAVRWLQDRIQIVGLLEANSGLSAITPGTTGEAAIQVRDRDGNATFLRRFQGVMDVVNNAYSATVATFFDDGGMEAHGAGLRAVRNFIGEAFASAAFSTTSTGYVALGPTHRFTAPRSGRVWLGIRSGMRPDGAGHVVVACRVFRVSDQVTVFGPDDEHALITGPTANQEVNAGTFVPVNLTPGVQYDARIEVRSSNGVQVTVFRRQVVIIPSL